MKVLYKLTVNSINWSGTGIFIEDKEKVEWLLREKPRIYFRNHVSGILEEDDIIMVTDDPDDLKVVERLELEHGINPFWYPTREFETVNDAYDKYRSDEFHKNNPYTIKTGLWV